MALLSTLLSVGGALGASFLSRGGGGSEQEFRDEISAAIAQRQGQIDSFRQELALTRDRLSNRIASLQKLTFQRFGGQAEAQFGGRGLQVTGGAFQSALAREAAGLQAQQDVAIAQTERQDITNEQNLRSQLFGQRLSGLTGRLAQETAGGAGRRRQQEALGGLAGQLGIQALGGIGSFLRNRPRTILRGITGGAGEEGIVPFKNVIG